MDTENQHVKRPRASLKDLTVEQRLEHRRAQNRASKQRYDAKMRASRPPRGYRPTAPLNDEMLSWIHSIVDEPLDLVALKIDVWGRENRMQTPSLPKPEWGDPNFQEKERVRQRWGLARLMSVDAIRRERRRQRAAEKKAVGQTEERKPTRNRKTEPALSDARKSKRADQEAAILAKRNHRVD